MKKSALTVFILSALACSKSGTLDLGGGIGSVSTGDTSASGTTETSDTATTYTTDTEILEQLAGRYMGEVSLVLWGGTWDECSSENESSFEIDAVGSLIGTGRCKGGRSIYPHAFVGRVNEDAQVSGVVSITANFSDDGGHNGGRDEVFDFDFQGDITGGKLEISWFGKADLGTWSIDVEGEAIAD